MSDEQLLDDLRARFDVTAADVPDRRSLEAQLEELVEPRRKGSFIAAGFAAAILLIGGLAAMAGFRSGGSDAVDLAIENEPRSEAASEPVRPSGRPFSTTLSGAMVDMVLPEVTNGRWSVSADTDVLVEMTLALSAGSAGDAPALRLFTVPELDAAEVADQLVSGLFDTDVLGESEVQLGELRGVEIAMASRQGTSRAAFRLGAETYVETIGIDRRYLVRIFTMPSGSFVIWLDAARSDFDRARVEADRLQAGIILNE